MGKCSTEREEPSSECHSKHTAFRFPVPSFPSSSSLIVSLADISYTKAPEWINLLPNFEHDQHTSFWSLATLAFPETRRASLVPPYPSPINDVFLPPDEHLLCFDYLYYVCTHQVSPQFTVFSKADLHFLRQPTDIEFDFSPVWRNVGQHLRWVPSLEQLGEAYARAAMGIFDPTERTPPVSGVLGSCVPFD
jgi:hypothetical protein